MRAEALNRMTVSALAMNYPAPMGHWPSCS
jgi:hypothetical protein